MRKLLTLTGRDRSGAYACARLWVEGGDVLYRVVCSEGMSQRRHGPQGSCPLSLSAGAHLDAIGWGAGMLRVPEEEPWL
jgi:hypothetical protein